MNATTPRLRAHLLAELRDLDGLSATTDQLAAQVPNPYGYADRTAPGSYVYPHLVALEKQGLLCRIKPADSRSVHWHLVTA